MTATDPSDRSRSAAGRPLPLHAAAWVVFMAGCGIYAPSAPAQQRAQDNALTSAEDAFGTAIGLQSVGLYSPTDARGFNPQQAENIRIEGLYFDQQTAAMGSCMVRETTMRIGIAAQSYSFPSPTGIADLSLRTPGDLWAFSGLASRGPFATSTIQLEEQIPIKPTVFSIDVCGGYYHDFLVDSMRHDHTTEFGTTFRWRPNGQMEITPFWSYLSGGGRQILPTVYSDGTEQLAPFRQTELASQPWTTLGWHMQTLGTTIKSEFSENWKLAGGIFHSQEHDPVTFNPYYQLNPSGTVDSAVDVSPPLEAKSTSGEVRLTGVDDHAAFRQKIDIALRGRLVSRTYGGDDDIDFGNIALLNQTQFPPQSLVLTRPSEDHAQQLDVGLTYEVLRQGLGSMAIGLLKDTYRRSAEVPTFAPDTFRTQPWLVNLRMALQAGPHLVYYGSYNQGLEDSALAPINAINRGEPPSATRTWQVDGGLRYVPVEKLRIILGAFDIHKPYLNLDVENVYRPLGRLNNLGGESSVSYGDHGLTVLAGAVLIKPRVDFDQPQPGTMGSEPLGPVPLTLTANIDYAPPWAPVAASLQWNHLSSRYATSDDRQRLSPLATIGAGVRYQWKLGQNSGTLRFDGFNLTNARGLHISALDQVTPEQSRRISLTLAVDL